MSNVIIIREPEAPGGNYLGQVIRPGHHGTYCHMMRAFIVELLTKIGAVFKMAQSTFNIKLNSADFLLLWD